MTHASAAAMLCSRGIMPPGEVSWCVGSVWGVMLLGTKRPSNFPLELASCSTQGIINKDGALAEFLTLPASNLHVVPDELSDLEAAFAEPLAAACRILEQGLLAPKEKQIQEEGHEVAVIGDGKLGLLVAAVSLSQ